MNTPQWQMAQRIYNYVNDVLDAGANPEQVLTLCKLAETLMEDADPEAFRKMQRAPWEIMEDEDGISEKSIDEFNAWCLDNGVD